MTVSLSRLQAMLLALLKAFDDLCRERNLAYFLDGGTLLGAVRHQGFIPWDDDVDVMMPREDYARLMKNAARWLPPGLRLDTCRTAPACAFPYAKLVDLKCPVVTVEDPLFPLPGEVIVKLDVYPLDDLGDDLVKARRRVRRVEKLVKLAGLIADDPSASAHRLKRLAKAVLRRIPARPILMLAGQVMGRKRLSGGRYVTRWREGSILEREVFGQGVLLSFHGLFLMAPEQWDAYLRGLYGDYTLPKREEEDRPRHDASRAPQDLRYSLYLKGAAGCGS